VATLNPRQQESVTSISTPLLVLAGAGSGKTSVITQKIAYLIKECGYEGRHIAAVTFTNKAAREMKERVGKLVSGPAARGLTVSTFHNLGLNIIRKEHKTLGFKPGFSIFDAQDALALIKELMIAGNDADTEQAELFQHAISNLKNDLTTPAEAMHMAGSPQEMAIASIFQRYNDALQAYNAVDFDDLILIPALLFRNHKDVLDRWQKKIRYLLVDEYQDTNGAQYELVKMLVGDSNGLTVVGDDDQSIYAWRGAKPENLALLQSDYPHLKVVKLEQNYRSTSRILRSANTVIANNPHVFDKQLWSELGLGEKLRVVRCKNEDAEAERVVTEILDQRMRKKRDFKDYAILYRGNHQSRILEIKLQAFQVPYNISGGTSFFARNEIKDIMAYLKLLINPDDDNAFLRIVNVPRRKIGTTTLQALGRYANERDVSMFQATHEIGLKQFISEAAAERLEAFAAWIDNIAKMCEIGNPIDAIKEMLDDMGYEAWLHQNSSSPTTAERRMSNVWYLIDSLKTILERAEEEDEEVGIKDAIAKLVLRDMLERQAEEEETDQVQLMTMHASKGLEFPHVYIVGMEEEILPHRSSIEEDNIEEERRLAYVGITRAKQTLTMTLASKRKQFGEMMDCLPSRFLDEIPEEDLEREGFGDDNPELNQRRGRETMADLKNMFD
jgi:ATP-dependent DNA helicase Rep